MNEKTRAKARYFSRFALSHMREMRILKEGGLLGLKNWEWRNVAEHCLTEAVGADILAEHLGADRDLLIRGALLHDWYKSQEIAARRRYGGAKGYLLSSQEDVQRLRELGVPEQVIKIAHANIPQSADPEYLRMRSQEEKIMHYIDMITDQSTFIEPEERLQRVEKNPAVMEFLESFRPQFGGKHLNEVQREVLRVEQAEFENSMGLKPGSLIAFLNQQIQERLT